jgi:GTP-binding protein
VILVAKAGVNSLMALAGKHHIKAKGGNNGLGSGKHGACADDLVINVPPGTVVIDRNNGLVLKDLAADGESVIAARGGKGGRGNTRFKSSTNQAPRQATEGQPGEVRQLTLELKVIADVGLIGKPNAGKSTLLSRVSSARPEIADYPFTTKYPNLGMVQLDLDRTFVMADIPGLIEGASEGVGLGHDFLKHIERSGLLVHLVEPFPADQTDPVENWRSIRKELTQFNETLGERPEVLVMSKCELPESDEVAKELAEASGSEVFSISAVTGEGLPSLLNRISSLIIEERGECKKW